MNTYGGVDAEIHAFLTLVLAGGEWSASRSGYFIPSERAPGTHPMGDWVGLRAHLDNVKIKCLTLPGLEPRPLGRPTRSQLVWSLCYVCMHVRSLCMSVCMYAAQVCIYARTKCVHA
jgi:hypothetical protein